MEIQFFGGTAFTVKGKKAQTAFDVEDLSQVKDFDIATRSAFDGAHVETYEHVKKFLYLPGEYEASQVLIKGLLTGQTIIYKIVIEGLSFAHFGSLTAQPEKEVISTLGDVDIALINVSESFNEKEVQKLIETIDPRMAIVGGDAALLPKVREESHAQIAEKNPLSIKKSELSDDVTTVMILPV